LVKTKPQQNPSMHFSSKKQRSKTKIKNNMGTCHFINNECELKSYLLSCFKNSESRSSENLKKDLLTVIQKWGLENNIAACTIDNAHNIVNAVSLMMWLEACRLLCPQFKFGSTNCP